MSLVRSHCFILAALLGLAACGGHAESNAILLRAPASPNTGDVELYLWGQMPTRRFYEMGFVQATGFGGDDNVDTTVHELSRRAGELGCEALVKVTVDAGYSRAHAVGVCVRFLETRSGGAAYVPPKITVTPKAVPDYRSTPAPRPVDPLPSSIQPGTGP